MNQWIGQLKQDVPRFLEQLRGNRPGFFHYSMTGDLFGEDKHWGLGNTVFAVKIYYTLGLLDEMSVEEKREMIDFIQSFKNKDGEYFDPLVKRKAFWREKLSAIKRKDFQNFFHQQTKRAETRQAISALNLLGVTEHQYPKGLPETKAEVEKYLDELDWTRPWGAGSHFSHLLFFLMHSGLHNRDELIDHAIHWVNKIQDPASGSWFKGDAPVQEKINGAMKVITGLKAANRMQFGHAEKLIDLCLSAKNDEHACDNFNIIYVLKYANEMTDGATKSEEIQQFARDRLDIYKEYYWPKFGGFSFLKGRSGKHYYGATIARGLPEPDVHGTVMFLWGAALINQMAVGNFRLKEFIT